METKAKTLTRREKSASRKQKLKRQKKIALLILFLILGVSLVGLGGWVYVNKTTGHRVNAQYQMVDQQRYLKTKVTKTTATAIQTRQEYWDWLLSPTTQKNVATFLSDYKARQQRSKAISGLMDGKNYYRDTVTDNQLTQLDRTLLKEKNQTVYQKQKNQLDTVQVWFAQTTDGNRFIEETYQTFQTDKDALTQEKVSEASVYYKLLKNRKIKSKWHQPIQEMTAGYTALEKEKSKNQAQADQEALDALKNSPLTQAYTPAKVTIVSGSNTTGSGNSGTTTDSDDLTAALTKLGVTASRVLVLDDDNDQIYLAQRSSGQYMVSGSRYSVLSNGLSEDAYRIRALIQDPGNSAGVVTSGSDFGTYFTTPPADYAEDTNTIADFNAADPVFWFKNQPALSNAILVTSGQTMGFITSSNISSANVVRVSAATLASLMSSTSTGTTFAVI